MREVTIEDYLVEAVAQVGGVAPKWGWRGWPDRIVALPRGKVGFLELKAPGETPSRLQLAMLKVLRDLGFAADWTDSFAGVDEFVRRLRDA